MRFVRTARRGSADGRPADAARLRGGNDAPGRDHPLPEPAGPGADRTASRLSGSPAPFPEKEGDGVGVSLLGRLMA